MRNASSGIVRVLRSPELALKVDDQAHTARTMWNLLHGNADHNAARNVLHLYRMGLALVPAGGKAVVRRVQRAKPAAAR
ncbi:hypothetical protein [Streptomyces sp. NBC_00354]|uniref:hypothetical protein n=1 Tax=Streptomyces sp. NBC_00354 TaxID=2975723 RepID=UPI002E276C57